MTRKQESDDVFWNIALHNDTEIADIDGNDTNGNDEELSTTTSCHNNHNESHTYELNIPPYGRIFLNLIPLSVDVHDDDAMIPLGAEAWYGSSLLAAMFEQIVHRDASDGCSTDNTTILRTYLSSYLQRGIYNINILELGSGAVGLASLVAGLSVTGYMHQYEQQQQQQQPNSNLPEQNMNHTLQSYIQCHVILTDYEPSVLQRLYHNVHLTAASLEDQYSNQFSLPEFVVCHLDWENMSGFQYGNHNGLHLVIGSELVYNFRTAMSCAKIIIQLLQENPNALVLIVNNANREGWDTAFLSTIYKAPCIRFLLEALNNNHLHRVASNFIRPGGTLNPCSDFSVLYVWNEQHN